MKYQLQLPNWWKKKYYNVYIVQYCYSQNVYIVQYCYSQNVYIVQYCYSQILLCWGKRNQWFYFTVLEG